MAGFAGAAVVAAVVADTSLQSFLLLCVFTAVQFFVGLAVVSVSRVLRIPLAVVSIVPVNLSTT
jgi:hypothetical protein